MDLLWSWCSWFLDQFATDPEPPRPPFIWEDVEALIDFLPSAPEPQARRSLGFRQGMGVQLNRLSEEQFRRFCEAFRGSQAIQSLLLFSGVFSPQRAALFAESLAENQTIDFLMYTEDDPQVLECFVASLARSTSIKKAYFSCSSDESAQLLQQLLEENKALETLSVTAFWNMSGVNDFANGLKANTTLKSLSLTLLGRHSSFRQTFGCDEVDRDDVGRLLLELLQVNRTITDLSFTDGDGRMKLCGDGEGLAAPWDELARCVARNAEPTRILTTYSTPLEDGHVKVHFNAISGEALRDPEGRVLSLEVSSEDTAQSFIERTEALLRHLPQRAHVVLPGATLLHHVDRKVQIFSELSATS